jgi:hypothetical protein
MRPETKAGRQSVNHGSAPATSLGMIAGKDDDPYGEQETRRRVEAALRAAFSSPPKRQSEMKLGKPRGKEA